jgi:methionyl-tRNA formyltransferase
VYNIPKVKGEFKKWTVRFSFPPLCCMSYIYSMDFSIQLPDPFALSVNDTTGSPPASHLLVTASFGRILTGKMLNPFQPPHRLNVHPSLLPAYRGPAPIQHTIMNGETETGVCVIQMLKKSEGIDAGALFGCQKMV